jgi:hypothetical protein
MSAQDVERFLPTVERARAMGPIVVDRGWLRSDLNLWETTIARVEHIAAIAMLGRMLRRDAWSDDEELSAMHWQRLSASPRSGEPPFAVAQYTRILATYGAGPCSHCIPGSPGRSACAHCAGSGFTFLYSSDQGSTQIPCYFCVGGVVGCTHCEGTGQTVRAKVEYVEHKVEPWASVVMPDVPPKASLWLHDELEASMQRPEALRFPLDRMLDTGPYRAASMQREPEFRGYRFHGSFERARAALQEITGRADIIKSEYLSYAIPILWITFEESGRAFDAAFITDERGSMRAYAGSR